MNNNLRRVYIVTALLNFIVSIIFFVFATINNLKIIYIPATLFFIVAGIITIKVINDINKSR